MPEESPLKSEDADWSLARRHENVDREAIFADNFAMLQEYEQEMNKLRQLNELIKAKKKEQQMAHLEFSSDKKVHEEIDA